MKAHECLQNLQDTKGSDADKEVNTRFSDSTSSFAALAVSTESKSVPPKRDAPPTNRLRIQRSHRRVLKFTANEDDCQWTAILRDPDYAFQEGRMADSLKKRAELKLNAPINSKVQHPLPGHLNFGRLACSNPLPSGQKSRSNAPPISTELPLLEDKFRLQSTLYVPFRERYAVMTPSNFFERPF